MLKLGLAFVSSVAPSTGWWDWISGVVKLIDAIMNFLGLW